MADTWLLVCLLTVHLLSNGIISASRFSSAKFQAWDGSSVRTIFHDMNTPPVTWWEPVGQNAGVWLPRKRSTALRRGQNRAPRSGARKAHYLRLFRLDQPIDQDYFEGHKAYLTRPLVAGTRVGQSTVVVRRLKIAAFLDFKNRLHVCDFESTAIGSRIICREVDTEERCGAPKVSSI
ncbi:hypothetical protein BD779DRAFT_1479585 [Infundibulicybe gibba]|nr:hypothetical protein BD779DRAFT_1479585 [Infundibulicybe gibba]